jgi:MYXO-CTERM domain-containing protein
MRLSRFIVLATVTTVSLVAPVAVRHGHAFFPESYYTGWGAVGRSHQKITELALEGIVREVYGYAEPPRTVERAIEEVVAANALVDKDQYHSGKHFDGENWPGAQAWIHERRALLLERIRAHAAGTAREALGQALHTIQDFYSHSNWIELGNSAPHPEVATAAETLSGGSRRLEITCRDCKAAPFPMPTMMVPAMPTGIGPQIPGMSGPLAPAMCNDCSENLVSKALTSGYYTGEDVAPGNDDKCDHGGSFDKAEGLSKVGAVMEVGRTHYVFGINKDSFLCKFSPHYTQHEQAADVAIEATKKFLRELRRELTPLEFQLLLGVGPSFGVVLDVSGSMEMIMEEVGEQAFEMVESREGTIDQPAKFVYVPFSDPKVGPVLVTSSADVFEDALDSASVSAGGDCPELSLTATLRAVEKADYGSGVFLFTDAEPKDPEALASVKQLAVKKGVEIYPFVFGQCSAAEGADLIYYELAMATGGQAYTLTQDQANLVTRLIDDVSRSGRTDIARAVRQPSLNKANGGPLKFVVDDSFTRITVAVSGSADATLHRPNGALVAASDPGVRITQLTKGVIYRIEKPESGMWNMTTRGAQSTISVSGESTLGLLEANFAELNGRPGHFGFYPIDGQPLIGKPQYLTVRLDRPVQRAQVEFRDPAGELIATHELTAAAENDGLYVLPVTPPSEPFATYVTGLRGDGQSFQRSTKLVSTPQHVDIDAPLGVLADRGTDVEYEFTLINTGAPDQFLLQAHDQRGFLRSPAMQVVSLAAGESAHIKLTLHLPESAPYGEADVLTLAVQSQTNPKLTTAASVTTQIASDLDLDDDLLPNPRDNCPELKNGGQEDADADGLGDVCDPTPGSEKKEDGCSLGGGRSPQGALPLVLLFAIGALRRRRASAVRSARGRSSEYGSSACKHAAAQSDVRRCRSLSMVIPSPRTRRKSSSLCTRTARRSSSALSGPIRRSMRPSG